MFRRFALLIALLLTLPAGASAHESGKLIFLPVGEKRVVVNGTAAAIDVPAQIMSDRTMVPVRFVSETIGASVSWDGTERKVTVQAGDRTVETWVDKTEARVNGQAVTLDVAPQIVDGRTLVPLRFVSENLGLTVGWDQQQRAVYVVSGHVDNVVLMKNWEFQWSPVPLKPGATLVFFNLDSARHNVAEDTLKVLSPDLPGGYAYTLRIDQAGTFLVYCDIHPSMELKVDVK